MYAFQDSNIKSIRQLDGCQLLTRLCYQNDGKAATYENKHNVLSTGHDEDKH